MGVQAGRGPLRWTLVLSNLGRGVATLGLTLVSNWPALVAVAASAVAAALLGAVGLLAVWRRRVALAPFLVIVGAAGILSSLSRLPLRALMQGEWRR